VPRPSNFSWFDRPNNILWTIRSQSSPVCSLLHSPLTSFLLGVNISQSPIFKHPQPVFLPQCDGHALSSVTCP
jgi:hypothetical protein